MDGVEVQRRTYAGTIVNNETKPGEIWKQVKDRKP